MYYSYLILTKNSIKILIAFSHKNTNIKNVEKKQNLEKLLKRNIIQSKYFTNNVIQIQKSSQTPGRRNRSNMNGIHN